MTLPELSAKISGAIAGKAKPLLDDKQDKLAVTGAANKGVYVSAAGVVSPMTYELNANVPANFAPATAAPLMDGTAAVGTSAKYAREDHRHDTDTSRASATDFAALRDFISRMEIHCTASGNPAIFSDAAAANVKALSVTITPTQSGSGDPSPSNVRPITGVSSVSVTRTGQNLCPIEVASTTVNGVTFTVNQSAGTVAVNGTASATVVFYLNGASNRYTGNTWILTGCPSGGTVSTYCLKMYIYPGNGYGSDTGSGLRFNGIDDLRCGIAVYSGVTVNNLVFRPMIRLASDTGATFEPYQGQTVTVTLTDGSNPLTVYGGTLDVTAGTLSVTWANIAGYNGEALPGRWISDRDVYASGATPTTGAQVVYELAAPLTYQLTPQQLATLAGYNAVSSDAGTVDVTYKANASIVFGGG